MYVCLSVCLSIRLFTNISKNQMSELHQIFDACFLWPWFSSRLAEYSDAVFRATSQGVRCAWSKYVMHDCHVRYVCRATITRWTGGRSACSSMRWQPAFRRSTPTNRSRPTRRSSLARYSWRVFFVVMRYDMECSALEC